MSAIAIVGIGCRFPGGVTGTRSFWSLLRAGASAIKEIPPDRWSLDGFYDASPDNPFRSYSKWGGFLDDVTSFDCGFFGLSRRQAEAMDPQQRVLLEVAYEALQDAGIPLARLREWRTGVFVGVSNADYGLLQRFETGVGEIHAGTGTALSIVANRISNVLDLGGPSLGVDTACSSSLVALDTACRALDAGAADAALVGGVNILLDPRMFLTFCRAHMLSPSGRIAAFGAGADGFVRGEGAGMILLRRLADAQHDRDRIYAVVKATVVNQDGATDSITAPNEAAQKAMMRAAVAIAGVPAADVAYVEAHGTGTPLGDPIEAAAIGEVFGQVQREGAVLIGSVKTNIGHLEPAAGIAGLIKTALVLDNGHAPPSINFGKPNPRIPFDALNIEVVGRHTALGRDRPLHALVNSFGFGGTNACAILATAPKEPPQRLMRVAAAPASASASELVPVPLSAPTREHLAAWARELAAALAEGDLIRVPLERLAAALIRQRSQFGHRAVVFARDAGDLAEKLIALADGRDWPREKSDPAMIVQGGSASRRIGKLVFTCTGQGGQFWNMGRDLLENHPDFRRFVEKFDALFEPIAGWSVVGALSAGQRDSRLHDPAVTPAAMFALQAGLAEVWKAVDTTPDIVIGHSFGEVTAAYLAGAVALADVAHLVNHRGLIRGHIDRVGAMAAIGLGADELAEFLPEDGSIEIGAYNSPAMVTVSGARTAIEDLIARLKVHDQNILARLLDLDFAWHSSWLEPGKPIFLRAVGERSWRTPHIPVISTVTGLPETRFDTEYWWRNLRQPVRFDRAVDFAIELGADRFVELGPSRTLSSPTLACAAAKGREVCVATTLQRDQNNFASFNQAVAELYVAGQSVAWDRLFEADGKSVVLPAMPWLEEPLWQGPEEATRYFFPKITHPLLGRREAGPEYCWSSLVSIAAFPVLAGHRIMGSCVLPGAVMIVMMRAAATDLFGARPIELSDVQLPEALFLGNDDRVVLRTQFDSERSRIRIWSRPKDRPEHWTLRAQAQLFMRDMDAEPLAADENAGTPKVIDVADFYQAAMKKGYSFGSTFQGVRRIERVGRVLHGEVGLPHGSASAIDDAALDPRLLDCCLQVMIADLGPDQGIVLPEHIDRILIGAPLGEMAQVSVVRGPLRTEGRSEFSLSIGDATGRTCLRIEGLRAKAIEMRRVDAAGSHSQTFIEENFVAVAPEVTGLRSQTSVVHWLIVSRPNGGNAGALARALTADGHNVSLLPCTTIAMTQETEAAAAARCGAALAIAYAVALDIPNITGDWPMSKKIADEVTRLVEFGRALAGVDFAGNTPTIWLLTRNARSMGPQDALDAGGLMQSALIGAARALAIECPGLRFRLADFDRATLGEPDWARFLSLADDVPEFLVRDGRILASRLLPKRVDDIELRSRTAAMLPTDGDFVLQQKGSRTLDTLFWQENRQRGPQAGEVRVRVDVAALNFRDVMAATGLLPKDAENRDGGAALGLEFAGEIERCGAGVEGLIPGTRVLGMASGSLRRHLTLAPERVYRVPAMLSDAQAASIPSVYLTAYYALSHLGRLGRGETVLIHSGAGGLGTAAIALAKWLGAEVFATAGSPEKRAYLSTLGLRGVLDSRSLGFADALLRANGGKGVDLVLNALSGPFIEKGLACVAPYGRFIEVGKRDVFDDHAIGLKALRRNVSFHVVDLAALIDDRPDLARRMMKTLLDLFEAGEIPPPPVTVFPAGDVTKAFRRFSDVRHIGKIALDLRDPDLAVRGARDTGFTADANATYLVTGGLSGFGFVIGRRLAEAGAGRVVLASRSGIPRDEVQDAITRLTAGGADIAALALDVTDGRQVEATIRELSSGYKPLKGIVHAAVTYADAALQQMSRDRIETVLATKVAGGLNLTAAVIAARVELDFFLSISSLAQVVGWRGQINYAAANAFLEGLAAMQDAHGIPGRCINLGMLSEAGVVARSAAMSNYLRSAGWLPLGNEEALDAVITALSSKRVVTTYAAADWKHLRASETAIAASGRLDVLASEPDGRTSTVGQDLSEVEAPARKAIAMTIIRDEVAAVLRLDPAKIETRAPLNTLGLDSLSTFELWNRIAAAIAMTIPLARFIEAATVEALAELVCALVEEAARAKAGAPASAQPTDSQPNPEDAASLLPRQRWPVAMRAAPMTSDEGRRALEVGLAITLNSTIDDATIENAWKSVAQDHEMLRTPPAVAQPTQDNWSGHSPAERVRTSDFAVAASQPLAEGKSARLVYACSERATEIALRASRACLDQWSVALVMQQLLESLSGGSIPRHPPEPPWQEVRRAELSALRGSQRLVHAAFWAEMLKKAPPSVYFAKRNRALAPTGFGLNRGPTSRLKTTFARDAAGGESDMCSAFAQALKMATGANEFIIACDVSGRNCDAIRNTVGPIMTTVPLICRLTAEDTPPLLGERIARDLQNAKAHAAFDLAAAEDAFADEWRANNIMPAQFGFSYLDAGGGSPPLMAPIFAPRRFGTSVAQPGIDINVIANDIRLAIWLDDKVAYSELAYDRDAVETKFAELLFEAFLDHGSTAMKRNGAKRWAKPGRR